MAGLTNAAKNLMLDALAGVAEVASLHSADPGTTGANELAGGAPAYARQPITWNAAAAGNLDNNANPTFDVPPNSDVAFFGLWTSGGAFLGGGAVTTPEHFAGQGTYTLTDADVGIA